MSGESSLGKRTFFDAVMSGSSEMISSRTGVPSGIVENLLRTGIDTLSSSGQQSFINDAQHAAEQLSGGSTRDFERSNISMPGAALIPGRGAELPMINNQFQKPSRLKLRPSGAKMHNAFAEQVKAWGPVDCKMSFAYKAILPVVLAANVSPPTRFHHHMFFRHCLNVNQPAYNSEQLTWHNTLGPDDSLIRQAPPSGSLIGAAPAGYNTSLRSPYRYPSNGTWQAVRLTRPILENIGWNCNPLKFITADTTDTSTILQKGTPFVYKNAQQFDVDTAATHPSIPSQQPRTATGADASTSTACYYRSQMSEGNVSYQFCNDGTSAVVVDVVITKLKKGKTYNTTQAYTNAMLSAFGAGYVNMSLANRGVINLAGGAPTSTDVYLNSKVEFLPEKALKYYSQTSSVTAAQPFAFVARDQFIVAAGCVKPWSFALPAVNYDARGYLQDTSETELNHDVDDLTYCVSMSYSTVSTPLVESGTVGRAVIDRRGNAVNVSVTGTYKETPHPAYLADYVNNFYVNGVLNAPYFTSSVPTLSRVNILPPESGSRTDADGTSYMVVGPSNTQNAA